jgi:lambda repressor-like predicted transcriptional regulator
MNRLTRSFLIASIAILAAVATVAGAGPTPSTGPAQVRDRDTIPAVLGLTQAQVRELRHDGLSLAQIAARQKVDPQKLVDALVAQWTVRIEARVANGGLTAAEATTLKTQLAATAKAMVERTALGGMQGAAVGAGRGQMGGNGAGFGGGNGPGNGICDGSGRQGRMAP